MTHILLGNVHDGLVFREDMVTRLDSLQISNSYGTVSTNDSETKDNYCITYWVSPAVSELFPPPMWQGEARASRPR